MSLASAIAARLLSGAATIDREGWGVDGQINHGYCAITSMSYAGVSPAYLNAAAVLRVHVGLYPGDWNDQPGQHAHNVTAAMRDAANCVAEQVAW